MEFTTDTSSDNHVEIAESIILTWVLLLKLWKIVRRRAKKMLWQWSGWCRVISLKCSIVYRRGVRQFSSRSVVIVVVDFETHVDEFCHQQLDSQWEDADEVLKETSIKSSDL